MRGLNRNILVYALIAVIVLIGVYISANNILYPNYSLGVRLAQAVQSNILYPYNTTIFHLYVNNTGSSDISGLPIILYLNGHQLKSFDIQSLLPHQGSQINLSYTYPVSGIYNFSAIIDPSHLFNIQDRQNATASMTINVTSAELPNIYTSIPENGIINTQSFSLTQNGTSEALYLDSNYSLGAFSSVFDGNVPAIRQVFESVSPYIGYFNGAYASYANGTAAYTAWLQSGLSIANIRALLKNYKYSTSNFTLVPSQQALYSKQNSTTSVCIYYDRGWTKIVAYSNASSQSTCKDIVSGQYSGNESLQLAQRIKADKKMFSYQDVARAYNANEPQFIYNNSHVIGSSIESNNGVLTMVNFFQIFGNSTSHGAFFAGLISQNIPPANTVQRLCHDGIVFNGNTINTCTAYTPTSTGYVGEPVLLNSTEITSNYTVSLYSLINGTIAPAAHINALALLQSLKLNESMVPWKSMFQNGCTFNTSKQLGCKFIVFNFSDGKPSFTLTNNYNSAITLQKVSCSYSAPPENTTIGQTMAPGNTITLTISCKIIPPLGFVIGIPLNIGAVYAVNGQNITNQGIFNFTTFS